MTPSVAQAEMLVVPGWPLGWCPLHVFEPDERCGSWCWNARRWFAASAAELSRYWQSPERGMYEAYRRSAERRTTAA
jgi:hypothetical protein